LAFESVIPVLERSKPKYIFVKWLNLAVEVPKVHLTYPIFCKNHTHITEYYSNGEVENNGNKR